MSQTSEMRRLVLHAADMLAKAPTQAVTYAAAANIHESERRDLVSEARQVAAAMALAEGTLRMVAACMADDEPPMPDRDERGRFLRRELAGGVS